MEHTEKKSVEENISTPDAKSSKGIKIGVFIVIAIVILLGITKIVNNNKENSSSPNTDQNVNVAQTVNCVTLNLIGVDYNKYLQYNLPAGKKLKVILTNDYCPIWTSSSIDMYQDDDSKRTICGTKIVQGSGSTPSSTYLFDNTSNVNVLIKVGRSTESVEQFNFN